MVRGRAVVSTMICGVALLGALGALFHIDAGSGGKGLTAEFRDAFPLRPGDDVLMWGAKVGTVSSMRLSDRGTVSVEVSLLSGVARPRADATASVRAGDLLGSAYLDLSPGRSPRPLEGPIGVRRTFTATDVQDLLNSYDAPTRTAFTLLIDELGRALDRRGVDLNGAVLQLAPAIDQATRLSAQVADQRAHLRELIGSAHAVARSVGPRSRDLERLIDGFDRTFTVTAGNAGALGRGLAQLPPALAATRQTLGEVQSTAVAATPLAETLLAAAPDLTVATRRLTPFATDAAVAAGRLRPLVRSLGRTLTAGRRTFPRLATALGQVRTAAPGIDHFSAVFDPLIELAVKGSFGGLGRLASEPGTQPFESLPGRNWFRTVGVLGCESFGVPTAPGCMSSLLLRTAGASSAARRSSGVTAPSAIGSLGSIPSLRRALGSPPLPKISVTAPHGVVPPGGGAPTTVTRLLNYLLGR